jgi:TPR repeat protein
MRGSILRCRLCATWDARQWARSDAWETAHSNEIELWSQESERNLDLIDRASAVESSDPAAAFLLYRDAAEGGSAWAMLHVGWHYHLGVAVAADFDRAQEYYRRAIEAGSWMATIYYARLLAHHGHHQVAENLLRDGVSADFVPACYWLASSRYRRDPSRHTAREIKPLLQHAADRGHPMAQIFLARLMTAGRFGLRYIPAGIRAALRFAWRDGWLKVEHDDEGGGR